MLKLKSRRLVMDKCPTKSCHASSVLALADGSVLVSWFGGTAEGEKDVGIWLSRHENGAFSEPRLIDGGDMPRWNPVLFSPDCQAIYLYFKVGEEIPAWQTMLAVSYDGGRTFSPPKELVPGDRGGRGPVRNHPIVLPSGRVLAPASLEEGHWRAFVDISDDGGLSFRASGEIWIDELSKRVEGGEAVSAFVRRGVIQPALWADDDENVHMLLRSTEGMICRSDSRDGGRTWTAAHSTGMPNNNSGIDLARLSNGGLLLAHNPVGENWGSRSPMRLSASSDGGRTFGPLCDLDGGEGEFSYPSIAQMGDMVYVTYTYKRENIAFWAFQEA